MLRTFSHSHTTRSLAVSSTLALAASLAFAGTGASAQSFQATPTLVGGNATVTTGANTTTVTVNSPSAVINWAPNDTAIGGAPINFQPSGTTATFVNNPANTADFAVLNNILPTDATRSVQFNGTVLSQLQALSGASTTGGTVYFYSPGGILVGPSAVINVGNLGLTANPIAYNATTGAFGATGAVPGNPAQTVGFGQASSGASVQIMNGARVNANTTDGSYVAIVAPMIANRGTIQVNGSAALVAADAATITFNPSGLFNVSVDVGTSASGFVLTNSGTITGPAASGQINHGIYLATAPKNTLITMSLLAGSTTGFDMAGAANVSGNAIVLSGGYDIASGAVDSSVAPKGGAGGSVNIDVTGSNVTSSLTEVASNTASVTSRGPTTPTTLASALDLRALSLAFVRADTGGSITINGSASVTAIDPGTLTAAGSSTSGGQAQIIAAGGSTIMLHGASTQVVADSRGATSTIAGVNAGNGTGGTAVIQALNGGSITVDGSAIVQANGSGGYSRTSGVAGGNGQGGNVTISASDTNASLTFGSSVFANAIGYGGTGNCLTLCTAEAGIGTGGSVAIQAVRGTGTPGGGSSITAQGTANSFLVSAVGSGGEASHTNAGNGLGGNVSITVDSGNTLTLSNGRFGATAGGTGGVEDGTNLIGGNGTGGNINLLLHPGATFNSSAQFSIDASGQGGAGDPDSNGNGSSGGVGTGGFARILSDGGSGTFGGGVAVSANGLGGSAGDPRTTGLGGAGTGGTAIINIGSPTLNTNNATLTFSAPDNEGASANFVNAIGFGGAGYVGGTGTGGQTFVRTYFGTIQGAGSSLAMSSDGAGGRGNTTGATGGAGIGGQSSLLARNNGFGTATITFDAVSLRSVGSGGNGGTSSSLAVAGGSGGTGTGGNVIATAAAGDGKLTITNLIEGRGDGIGGNGGVGASNADATGSAGGSGGAAIGGFVQIGSQSGDPGTTSAGVASFGSVVASGIATGGAGGNGGNFSGGGLQGSGGAGGNATGGGATLLVSGTPVTVTGLTQLAADALGGNGGQGFIQGDGGNAVVGTNGQVAVLVTNRFMVPSQRARLTAGAITGSASAVGGTGFNPGTSTSGDQPLQFTVTNSDVTASSLVLISDATTAAPTAVPSLAMLSGGTANLGSAFRFESSGPITVNLDTATLTAGFVGLSGSDWILPATPPVLAGTINATTGASFTSDNNIVTYANVNFNYPVGFNVIGNFQLGNVTTQGDFVSTSGGTTTLGSINAVVGTGSNSTSPGNVDILAGKSIAVGPVNAAGYVALDNTIAPDDSAGIGDITIGGIAAGGFVGVFSNGSVLASSPIQAGADVLVSAGANATLGDVSAGIVNPSTNPNVVKQVRVTAGGAVATGNLRAADGIVVNAISTIATGTIAATDVAILGGAAIATGPITSSARVLVADQSLYGLGTGNPYYDFNPVFAATPVRAAGPVSISGAVQAGQSFTAATQQGFTGGALTSSSGPILVDAGGAILTGNVSSAGNTVLHAGGTTTTGTINAADLVVLGGAAMSTGSITASRVLFADQRFFSLGQSNGSYSVNPIFAAVRFPTLPTSRSPGSVTVNGSLTALFVRAATALDFTAGTVTVPAGIAVNSGGTISIGAVSAGNAVDLRADRNVLTGDVSVMLDQTPPDPNAANSATFAAGGSITTGNVQTRSNINFFAQQGLTTGALSTVDLLGLAAGTSRLGAITATGRVLLADVSMAAIGNGPSGQSVFDPNLVFAAAPVRSAGAISLTGPLTATSFTAATQQGFTGGALNATSGPILVDAGGAILAGNVVSAGDAILHASSTITTGTIGASTLLVLGGGAMSTQAINARGAAIFADASTYALGVTTGAYNVSAVIAGTPPSNIKPFRSAGAITINGPLNAAFIRAATAQTFSSGAITAPLGIITSAGGSVATGNLLIGNGFTLQSDANVTAGDIDVGLTLATTDPMASGFATFNAAGAVAVGNIRTRNGVLLIAGGAASVGSITTNDVLGLVHGASSYGPITATGRVLLADQAMAALGVTTTAPFFYDINPVFNAAPIQSTGSIMVNGAVQANRFTAATALGFTAGAITTGTDVTIVAGGAVNTGLITAGGFADIASGSLNTGPVSTKRYFRVRATGPVTIGGTIQAGAQVQLSSSAAITTGNVTAGFAPASTATGDFFDINIDAGGALTTGNLQTTASTVLHSLSTIQTGTINANVLGVLGGGSVSTGSINANLALFANQSFYTGQTTVPFNGSALLTAVNAQQPLNPANIGTTGSISINGPITGNVLNAYSAQDITVAGSIQEGNIAVLRAAGNIAAGNLEGGVGAQAIAGGNVMLGDVTGGSLVAGQPLTTSVVVRASGLLTTGNVRSFNAALINGLLGNTSGSITTIDLLNLSHGAIISGPITATGRVLLADDAMAALGNTIVTINGVARPTFDPNLVFNGAPIQSAGPITINGAVQAGQDFTAATTQAFTSGAITSGSNLSILAAGAVGTGALDAGGFAEITSAAFTAPMVATGRYFDLTSTGAIVVGGPIQAGADVTILGARAVTIGNIGSGIASRSTDPTDSYTIAISAGGPLQLGNLSAFSDIGLLTQQSLATGTLTGREMIVLANGAITTGAVNATGRVLFAAASMAALGGTFGDTYNPNLVFAATPGRTAGPITIDGAGGNAVVTGGFTAASGGLITINGNLYGNGSAKLDTGGGVTMTNGVVGLPSGSFTLTGAGPVQLANVTVGSPTSLGTINITSTGPVTTGFLGATNGVTAGGGSALTLAGAFTNAGPLSLTSAGTINAGSASTGSGAVTVTAPGAIVTSGLGAGTTLSINGGAAVQTGALNANGALAVKGVANVNVGQIASGGTVDLTSGGALAASNVSGTGNVTVTAGPSLAAGNVRSTGGAVSLISAGSLSAGTINAATTATLSAIGALQTGSINAGNQVTITADSFSLGSPTNTGTIVTTGGGLSITTAKALMVANLTINGNIALDSRTALTTGNVSATAGSVVLRSGGTLNAGVINATSGIIVNATGAATVQGLTSSGAIQFNTASTFTSTGNIVAASQVIGGAAGNLTLANVTASGGVVELVSSQGNLTTGRIGAATDVAAIAGGSLSLGQVSGRDVVLLAGSNVQVGNVAAGAVINAAGQITGATGRVLIANASIGNAGGSFGNYNFNGVFNATGGAVIANNPPRIGGTVNLVGPVNAGVFGSYSQGAMTGQVINAFNSLEVESGGLVTVAQRWTSPDLSILSNDIAIQPAQVLQTITTSAGLSSGTTGLVTLASLNPNGAFIGDGLTAGQGYALSNAEVGLVQSGSLTIAAAAAPNLATTMTIGTLSLTGPQAGSNVDNRQNGAVQFATGNPQTLVPGGTIRVTGAITAKGFLSTNQLQFNTGTFELDTTAGSITVTDSSNALAGGIAISADRIHIAAPSILDKLRANPLYVGRVADLNAPPTQPLAGPVLSASQLIFAPTQTLYIQNTGTTAVPAGFLVPLAGLKIQTPSTDSTQAVRAESAVSLVINGQFVGTSTTGAITGATAFQQFVQQTKLTGITADSQLNGCLISAGSCAMMTTPTPDLSTQIQVLQTPSLPSAPALVEAVQQVSAEVTADPQQQEQTADKPTESEEKQEKEAKASAKAPIAPPAPMIDTRPLSPPVSVDEPVAGGGNPALFGIGTATPQTEGGDK